MPTAAAIESLLIDELTAATRDVFKTMVFQEVEGSSPIAGDARRPGANVVGTVAFAGKTSGLVVFYSTMDAAQIITDWNMPEMSGIDFIRTVRSMPEIKDTPVLMVTTNAAKDDIVEALKAGVNSYVVKPFTPDTMKEKIEAVLAR